MTTPYDVVIWAAAVVFVATAVITLAALVGLLKLGGGNATKHHAYLKKLFTILIVETVVAGVAAFGAYLVEKSQGSTVLHESERQIERAQAHLARSETELSDIQAYTASLRYALNEYRSALKYQPQNVAWLTTTASILNELGRYAEAEDVLDDVRVSTSFQTLRPSVRRAVLVAQGAALTMQNKLEAASDVATLATKLDQNATREIGQSVTKYRSNDARRAALKIPAPRQPDDNPGSAVVPNITWSFYTTGPKTFQCTANGKAVGAPLNCGSLNTCSDHGIYFDDANAAICAGRYYALAIASSATQ